MAAAVEAGLFFCSGVIYFGLGVLFLVMGLFSFGVDSGKKKKKFKFHQRADKALPLKGVIWFHFCPIGETMKTSPTFGDLFNHGRQALAL